MAGAFLILSAPSNAEEANSFAEAVDEQSATSTRGPQNIPWCWPAWQQRTMLTSAPFSTTINEDTPCDWKLPEANQAVWTFISNFWAVQDSTQVDYIKKKRSDNDSKGRDLWLDYFQKKWSDWKVNSTVDAVLIERSLDPYSIMKRLKVANVALAYPTLAEALFGPDSFTEDGVAIKEPVRRFLDTLATHLWAKNRKSIGRERGRLAKLKSKVDQRWQEFLSLAEQNKLLEAESIRTWLKDVESLTKILTRYGDQESLKQLSDQEGTLSDLLQGLEIDVTGGSKCRLPKPLRQALSFLATQQDITLLAASIQDQLKLCDPEAVPADSWSEGVEEFNGMAEDELWAILGLPERRIPFFNILQDPYGNCDPWTESGQTWLKNPKNGEPLTLRWHQLVGLVKMVKNVFSGTPVLLMDEVGLGKTIQVTALIALLAFYREFYAMHNSFPGKIAAKQWRTNSANIPNLPVILVIPANLVAQFTSELHRFLQHGAFDVLPYLATWRSRQTWWQDIWSRSKQPEGRRIIITTPKALESDCDRIFEPSNFSPTTSPRQKANYAVDAPTTAYGRDFLLGVADEAHNYRNIRKGYWAIFCLRQQCHGIVAMTATPITSRPLDVWNIGRCLGLELFGSSYDDEALKMERQLRSAAVKDRKRFKQGDRITKIIMGTVMGNAGLEVPSLYRNQMLTWINIIRKRFLGVVIRRTIWSVDNHGVRISGLAPFKEHNLLVKLYSHEVENLELIAKDLVEEGGVRAAKFASGSDFYMRVRRALLHPSCNTGYPWADPSNLEEWAKDPSRKLDVLARVIGYHQERDDRPPLCIADDKLVVSSSNTDIVNGIADRMPCDKILVYCAFPSSYTQVLELHGILTLQIHGKLSTSARTDIIAEFKNSMQDGPRVLIISNVGLTGLNLPCANILIIVDSLWSATDEGQLIGRIYRPPQPKIVHIYRIVAADTQDVFLNNISFSKAAILDAFTGATPSLRSLFNNEEEVEETDKLSDIEEAPVKKGNAKDVDDTSVKKGNAKDVDRAQAKKGKDALVKKGKAKEKSVKATPANKRGGKKPACSDSLIQKPQETSTIATSSTASAPDLQDQAALPRAESLSAPSLIADGRSGDVQLEAQVIITEGRSDEFLQGAATQVSSSQGPPNSPIILPLKRPADSSYDDLEPKAQKSKTGDSGSAFLAQMEHAGLGVDQFVAFLKSLQNSSSQNPDHPLAAFVPGLGLATGLSTPPPLNATSSGNSPMQRLVRAQTQKRYSM
ncbi:P-loop containing nucleoside triphosphate hydrolase protein [Suillus placidus]|uniref:P-loop containing nucleoside triphosphate hydrolase protein n=1 Tax=Suillus placidus TaxID=48579 RepID=A0A9P6ZMU0_9AGAM|nr:P-loop containing nucleoside triphosphate hydrolase protein [Suillus placidus]